jgi:hypothetical protein
VIAIVELGGGWGQSDMQRFFSGVKQPVPQLDRCVARQHDAAAKLLALGERQL